MKLKLVQKKVNYLSFLVLLAGILFISGCIGQQQQQTMSTLPISGENVSAVALNMTATTNISAGMPNVTVTTISTPDNSCINKPTDTEKMDIFDSHVHIPSTISATQIILEMDKAGVSMSNLYSGSLEAISKYPGRFITFVDTPDSPQHSIWLTQGQSFFTSAETQLKTGKFYGIGEANLRFYSGDNPHTSPPNIYVAPDNPLWLQLVDLSARYHVPVSVHFVPDDPVANTAFEKMLNYNKDAIIIWAHIGFAEMLFNRATLNDFLLRYPNLYFDTAGVQELQNPPPQLGSNWGVLANQSDGQGPQTQQAPSQGQSQQDPGETDNQNGGRLNEEWRQFFETWNTRILFGSDAGGGANGKERWLNYADQTSEGATPNAIGHWTRLLSNLDYNSALNILSGNARTLFLKEQKPSYDYLVSSNGNCEHIFVSSTSSVSALTFNQSTRAITFTVADSIGTTGSAAIKIPMTLVRGNFTAQVDGQSVQIKEVSNSADTTITLEYAGGIRKVVISASP
ncbi:MAG: hypothetical protein Q7J54_01120 [Candidatus Woesearchaeota archaeon]|nr:hypothetical protein [Candidatus Woesearchaeota archaeon]